ncbi:MAG TPA: CaiB/BaiF CoA-transferase family protein [Xanthobacteraceae bacterium]|jgi:crotonobetainyl-CoA:carnitine CoA-transferase CaiB-like acyl-CoA transferase|nr:CaiB/BaiF CoA-transferase family protein [Xanthobacteraceae bacterium]
MKLLRGFTVLDLGTFITAPYAAMLLAELGADVIKVERPEGGDPFRWFAGGLSSPHFQAHNRHKRSVALDYTTPDGLKLLHLLIEHADALVINVRPGVEQRLGIDEGTLRRLNPKLVFCFITGFGADGPYANRPAYDNVGQALAGWLSRFHDTDDARVAGPAISDAATGIFACLGIVSALLERTKTGVGRKVEVSMLEATLALAVEPLAHYFVTGDEQPFYLRGAMSQAYILTCKDGKRIALQMSSPDKFWKGLAAVIESPDLLQRYPDRKRRVDSYEAIGSELAAIFATRPREEWLERLAQHDVPFAPERRLNELDEDPQVRHLDLFYELDHPAAGPVRSVHRAIRCDGSREIDFRPPPTLGEHTREVLAGLGLSDDELRGLSSQGVIKMQT